MERHANPTRLASSLLLAFALAAILCAATPAAAQDPDTRNPNAANANAANANTQDAAPAADADGNANAAPSGGNANAAPSGGNTGGAARTASVPPVCPAGSSAVVVAVRPQGGAREVELGDVIEVDVKDYQSLVDQAQCGQRKNIVLYLEDRPVAGGTIYPPSDPKPRGAPDPLTTLFFTLSPSYDPETGARDVWTYLLGQPSLDEAKPVRVSVGIEDQFAVPASNNEIKLKVVPMESFLAWLAVFAVLVAVFLLLAVKTDLLRDAVPAPGGGQRRPYSLARTQAAWWFFLVLASYILIGIITGDFSDTINGTAIALLGISAGTTLGSAFVDASKSQSPEAQAQEAAAATTLEAEIAQLHDEVKQLKSDVGGATTTAASAPAASGEVLQLDSKAEGAPPPALRVELAQKQAALETKKSQLKKVTNVSEHFLRDILSDVNGVSFHRFQMMAWSLVLGIIFVVQVYKVLAMPTFNSTLLALLGISAGTFVGLKIPEPTDPTAGK